MEYTANNKHIEYATNNSDEISNDLVVEKHKGASCKYCSLKWSRGRAYEMKSHLAIKCKGKVPKEIQIKVLKILQSESESTTPKKRKYPQLSVDIVQCKKICISNSYDSKFFL
ncbi:zinc finger bed domain-containing protein 1-like [Gigaspora margarita]|uniref:Zinc finger bed domain-containing protein 1-like n=1 Tax=Gigaspora margarita TaxID=4874 RepID=A0A8H3XAD7_GIGMA|nr:zinc finger bed domain-containing protein 1-like [Gigaspora margarita]